MVLTMSFHFKNSHEKRKYKQENREFESIKFDR